MGRAAESQGNEARALSIVSGVADGDSDTVANAADAVAGLNRDALVGDDDDCDR